MRLRATGMSICQMQQFADLRRQGLEQLANDVRFWKRTPWMFNIACRNSTITWLR